VPLSMVAFFSRASPSAVASSLHSFSKSSGLQVFKMVLTKLVQLSSLLACITSVFAQELVASRDKPPSDQDTDQVSSAGLLTHAGIEGAQANDDTYNSGGFIQVGGFNITVPKNMLVAFPAAYVPFKDFAADIDSMIGYEVEVRCLCPTCDWLAC
jgi:hypothetical protein